MKRVLREPARAVRPALIPFATRSLRRQAARAATVDSAIDVVFGFEFVRADSHAEQTRDRVRGLLRGRPVDFLFIDGDHSYDGVARDFELYVPLVRPGGIVALHDVVPQPAAAATGSGVCGGEVPRFWSELRAQRPVPELVEDWGQGRFGIGVLRV